MRPRSDLLSYEVTNAVLAWAVVGTLLAVAVERIGSGEVLWAAMAAVMAGVALVPPITSRRPEEMVAWEVLALAAASVTAASFGVLAGWVAYLAVAALALVVAAELDAFTAVEMTPDFAVASVVVATMAVAGLWVIARYASDAYLGTSFLVDQTAVMWDLIAATGVGVAAGLVFELYVRRVSPGHGIDRDPRGNAR